MAGCSSKAIPETHISEGWCEQCVLPNWVKVLAFKLYNNDRFGHVVGDLRWSSN